MLIYKHLWFLVMIFGNKEAYCILEVLKILSKEKSKYGVMFRKSKVSHITLQKVLKELQEKKFIKKYDMGHKKVDYEITQKGVKLLNGLIEIKGLVS